MIEDELIRIWQSSPYQERIKFDKSRLMIDVQTNLDRFYKYMKYGDLIGVIVAIIMIPFCTFIIYWIPSVIAKVGTTLIVLWFVYVLFRIRRLKKHKPNTLAGSYLNYLHESKNYLHARKRHSETLPYWAILPVLASAISLHIGVVLHLGVNNSFVISMVLISLIIFDIASGIVLLFLSKRKYKKQIEPRLEKVDGLIKAMENDD